MKLLAVALCAVALPAFGADEWVRLTTPHFELYTSAGEKKGRDAILYFEQVRSFVTEITHTTWDQTVPVRIIAFKSEKQFRPYAPNGAAAAYYAGTQSRDYIVMEDADSEHFPVAIDEYMHLVIQHSGVKLPLWLNEGWADVFSTLRPAGKDAMVGEVLKGHAQTLATQKWLDFDTLTTVDRTSPNYNEQSRAGIFYAESWALAHMLYMSAEYRDNFTKLLVALNSGKNTAEACQIAYGPSPAKVFSDLQAYMRTTVNAVLFPVKLEKSAEEPVLSPVSDKDSGVLMADLLAGIGRRDQARTAYEALTAKYPENPEILKSLGYLAWQGGDPESARKYFEAALPQATDPQMCYHLASFYSESHQPEKMIGALRKAVELKPDYTDARIQLGFAEMNLKAYPDAIADFLQLKKITPDHAPDVFYALAFADAQTGDFAEARRNLTSARNWAKTDSQTERANQLSRYLDAKDSSAASGPADSEPAGRPSLRRPLGDGTPPLEVPAEK